MTGWGLLADEGNRPDQLQEASVERSRVVSRPHVVVVALGEARDRRLRRVGSSGVHHVQDDLRHGPGQRLLEGLVQRGQRG